MTTDITMLAEFARAQAANFQAPPGQPNALAEGMTEIAMFLEQHRDLQMASVRVAFFRASTDEHNKAQRAACDARRVDTVPCSGNGKTNKCEDCPKRLGLSLTARTLT
jgi:hypothetical protein